MEESQDQGNSEQNKWRQDVHASSKAIVWGTNNTREVHLVPEVLRAIVNVLAVVAVGVLSAIYGRVAVGSAFLDLQAGLLEGIIEVVAQTKLQAVQVGGKEIRLASKSAAQQTLQVSAGI